MKVLIGICLALCLALYGCSDDDNPPADGGTDAVAEASVDASPAEGGALETGAPDAGAETSPDAGGPDGAAAEAGSPDGTPNDGG